MQSTFYTIYKTTNLVNSKIYIGKHVTVDLNDAYLGSGKLLKAAIIKYGIEHFKKEVLFVFDNEAAMNAKEKELVTEEFILQENNYNLCIGGQGGFGYINNVLSEKMKDVRNSNLSKITPDVLRENAYYMLKTRKSKGSFTREQNIVNATKAWTNNVRERRKQTRKNQKFQQGENNSQYGTIWITDGEITKKIRKTDPIPNGWVLGRTKGRKTDG